MTIDWNSLGYVARTFFYQIGGGEDEDDKTIFIKNGFAVWITQNRLYRCKYDRLSYTNGFPQDAELITPEDL